MQQRKHEISACIKSVGSAVCPEHLLEVEQAYKAAQDTKKSVTEELERNKKMFAERSEYLHRLKTNALVAAREVPLLRSELLKLKEKIYSLTFEAERWGKTCQQQEQKIADLEAKKRTLEKTFTALEEKIRAVSQEISQVEDDLHLLSDAILKFTHQKEELALFDGLELGTADAECQGGQTPTQIVESINAMAAEIDFERAETETFDNRSKTLASTIAGQNSEIEIVRSRIDTLKKERAGLQEAIDKLLAQEAQHRQDIEVLTSGYQIYGQIFAESQATEEQHQNLVTEVNQANTYLKEALLANNRLELSLRLENFKINLLFQEMETLL